MKIYLDDLRGPPAGWIKVTHPDEVISYILQGEAEVIDLDYHLGKDWKFTGLTVLKWLQNEILEGRTPTVVPEILIHTGDLQAMEEMEGIRSRIYEWIGREAAE
jgi:hypothetical protein